MVYRDYWALEQWYRHYGALLGAENLYIIAHGADPKIAQKCPRASIWTVPRDDLTGFDRRRGQMLNGFQAGLLQIYDWVIRTDVDELICTEPGLCLQDILQAQEAPAVFALGFNLVEVPGDPPLTRNVFDSRRAAVFTGHYSKAFAVREPLALMRHGVQLRPRRVRHFPFVMPRGLYLAHLKYASRTALEVVDALRMEIGGLEGKGLPGSAWRNASDKSAAFYARVAEMEIIPWEEARDTAYAALATNPKRDEQDRLIRARSLRFNTRTALPIGFGCVDNE